MLRLMDLAILLILIIVGIPAFLYLKYGSSVFSKDTAYRVIDYLKMNSSRDIHAIRPEEIVWQRSFYDHVIRGEDDYHTVAEYIDGNPARWREDCFYAE